ncbi:MAG: hypothetical protein CSA15_08065 [Candidatus Delongbacteria bacterium]|nr:MAG: hypothetical protein CSA15_08065 [Candidatus Delongbacteria bacterium]
MLKFFKTKNPYSLIAIPIILGVVIFLRLQIVTNLPENACKAYLPDLVFSLLPENMIYSTRLIGNLIILNIFIFTASHIVSSGNLMLKNNFLYPFVLLFILILPPALPEMLRTGASGLLTILSILVIIQTTETETPTLNYYKASLLIATASLINPIYIIFILFIPAALIIFRQPKFIPILSSILGFLSPYWIFYGLYYAITGRLNTILEITKLIQSVEIKIPAFDTTEIIYLTFAALMVIITGIFTISKRTQINIIHRQSFTFMITAFLISLLILILFPFGYYKIFPVVAFLASVPVSFFLNNTQKTLFAKITFNLFLILIIFAHINYHTHIFFK